MPAEGLLSRPGAAQTRVTEAEAVLALDAPHRTPGSCSGLSPSVLKVTAVCPCTEAPAKQEGEERAQRMRDLLCPQPESTELR